MKSKIFWIFLMSVLCFSEFAYANEGELVLDKIRLDFQISLGDSSCDELMNIASGKNIPDMRGFDCYHRTGKYTLTLAGPPGTTVTLFGEVSFGKDRGYLVIRKTDDRPVWLLDLEDFTSDQWNRVEAKRQSGAYEVFYHAAPIFSQNVSSIKWEKWWPEDRPD
ncbi:MAG: hypothetical protein NPINA01_20960 [Nitrospinaceae bacterium]|nr:MAG: hypothetical protein NPINA01_20960 [Nitrospinaceae bacterium]